MAQSARRQAPSVPFLPWLALRDLWQLPPHTWVGSAIYSSMARSLILRVEQKKKLTIWWLLCLRTQSKAKPMRSHELEGGLQVGMDFLALARLNRNETRRNFQDPANDVAVRRRSAIAKIDHFMKVWPSISGTCLCEPQHPPIRK
jgi:hypothetical protein